MRYEELPHIKRICPVKGLSNKIPKNKEKIKASNGEDSVLIFLAERIGVNNGFIVDVGAGDGATGSNSWALLNQYGYTGLLIEAEENRFAELKNLYQKNNKIISINIRLSWHGEFNIDSIFAQNHVPVDFDVLSIDIDGNDYYLWKSLTKFTPKIVVIEFNHFIPNDIIFIQDPDFSVNQVSSLRAIINLGVEKGYSLVATTGPNAFFVQNKFFDLFDIENNSIDEMFDDSRTETKIFQLYDGTIKVIGVTRLNWHNVHFSEDDFQILPSNERNYLPPERRN